MYVNKWRRMRKNIERKKNAKDIEKRFPNTGGRRP